jgi:hypothetical protein
MYRVQTGEGAGEDDGEAERCACDEGDQTDDAVRQIGSGPFDLALRWWLAGRFMANSLYELTPFGTARRLDRVRFAQAFGGLTGHKAKSVPGVGLNGVGNAGEIGVVGLT